MLNTPFVKSKNHVSILTDTFSTAMLLVAQIIKKKSSGIGSVLEEQKQKVSTFVCG